MATIKDIARETGLSIATISKFLNGGSVRPKNKETIERVIRELDYSVNMHARGLKTNRSMTIGAVIPELDNVFITTIMARAADVLKKYGYGLLICGCRSNAQEEAEAVRFLMGKSVDGMINMPITQDGSHLRTAIDRNLPVVLLDRSINALRDRTSAVLVDNISASLQATQALLDAGHIRIGIIVGPPDIFTSQQRLVGYNEAHIQSGLMPDPQWIVYGNYTVQGGHDAAVQLIQRGATAIFATNYEMTLGSVIAVNELGLKVPEDLSLIGFDNMQLSEVVKPKLTIVTQPLRQIGERAAEILIRQIHGGDCVRELLPASIVRGESIAKPKE